MNKDDEKYNGKTWEEWDETQYDCPQEGCGRDTSHVEEGYFQCRCGWFGQPITIIDDLRAEVKRLRERIDYLQVIVGDYATERPEEYCEHCYYFIDEEEGCMCGKVDNYGIMLKEELE